MRLPALSMSLIKQRYNSLDAFDTLSFFLLLLLFFVMLKLKIMLLTLCCLLHTLFFTHLFLYSFGLVFFIYFIHSLKWELTYVHFHIYNWFSCYYYLIQCLLLFCNSSGRSHFSVLRSLVFYYYYYYYYYYLISNIFPASSFLFVVLLLLLLLLFCNVVVL